MGICGGRMETGCTKRPDRQQIRRRVGSDLCGPARRVSPCPVCRHKLGFRMPDENGHSANFVWQTIADLRSSSCLEVTPRRQEFMKKEPNPPDDLDRMILETFDEMHAEAQITPIRG
jgi:hypothetical protein